MQRLYKIVNAIYTDVFIIFGNMKISNVKNEFDFIL